MLSSLKDAHTEVKQICTTLRRYNKFRLHFLLWKYENTHTHTHTHPFNGPLSGATRVSRYQKGKTNLDFTEARDSEWHWNQLGHMQVCISLQTDNHASTSPLRFFYRPDALPAAQPTASKHWRPKYENNTHKNEHLAYTRINLKKLWQKSCTEKCKTNTTEN